VRRSCDAENFKSSSDGRDSGSKKRKRWGYWGVAEFALGGSLESSGWFCVGAFGRNLASVAVKMFTHLICLKNKFSKVYTFNAICKDNGAINYITVQHKKVHSRQR
jgi:hypothetical protein